MSVTSAPTPPTLLRITDLGRTYGEPPHQVIALGQVSLDVGAGEMVAIMGPSGSGKSTLLTIAGGLETATTGSVELEGRPLHELSAEELAAVRRREVGFVFQGFNLLTGLTAAENVAAPLELDGVPVRDARRQAVEQLHRVALGDRAEAFPDDLSGGERQRVAIARALIGGRGLLLADEPTGALDSTTGAAIMQLLRDACDDGRAVVVVTHDPNVAGWADRIVNLRDGAIESCDTPGGRR